MKKEKRKKEEKNQTWLSRNSMLSVLVFSYCLQFDELISPQSPYMQECQKIKCHCRFFDG